MRAFLLLKIVCLAQRKPNASPCICFSRLSNQRFVRFAHAPVRSLTAPQRRLTTVTAKAHRFRLHPVNFFPACQIKDLSAPLTLINSLTAPQRRRSIVTQFVLLNASQMLHPVFVFLAPSLHKTFFGFISFRINLTSGVVCQYFAKRLLRA